MRVEPEEHALQQLLQHQITQYEQLVVIYKNKYCFHFQQMRFSYNK